MSVEAIYTYNEDKDCNKTATLNIVEPEYHLQIM